MKSWQSIHNGVPWLREGKPYFVHSAEEARLRDCLRLAEFRVVTMEGGNVFDERGLLLEVGQALGFPGYYGANWDAFADCVGDMVAQAGPIALIWTGADAFLSHDLHGFVRAVHELLSVARDLGSGVDPFQLELFFVGSHDAFRNFRDSSPQPPSIPS